MPLGAPGSPGNTIPSGALGKRCDCSPGMTEKVRPSVSDLGVLYSYRRPMRQHQVLACMPLVLAEDISALAANVGRRQAVPGNRQTRLQAENRRRDSRRRWKLPENRSRILHWCNSRRPGSPGRARIRRRTSSYVFPASRRCIGPGKGILHEARRTILTGTKLIAGIEKDVGGAGCEVGRNADAEAGSGGQVIDHAVLQIITAMSHEVKLIQQEWVKRSGYSQCS